ncbi:MAG TPA: RagB/SusD family nutrient uptake outer membrane protein [Chitinophagaceae bacterium]|nr:RagB/SusD family nutrient uptake outer membrane protein [Chitinophagaceae bacterium]
MKLINKIFFLLLLAGFFSTGCSKKQLDLTNPNVPGLPSLDTEEGIIRAGAGIHRKFGWQNQYDYWWMVMTFHNTMGDNTWSSVGNFGMRWANQTERIILDNGTVLTPPQGGAQGLELKSRNTRSNGDQNVFNYEWTAMYQINNQANLILNQLESPTLQLSGNVDAKKNTLKAWAYWWKGFAYSRIGSMYVAGIITDALNESNSDFKERNLIIDEATSNFEKCITALEAITDMAAYNAVMDKLILSFTKVGRGGIFTPLMWKRHINTYKARNILVNKKVGDITNAEWNTILTLTQDGLQQADKILTMRSADAQDVVLQTAWSPFRLTTNAWEFVSERWIQEFKAGDARRTRNVVTRPNAAVNQSGRGFQYGTRYDLRTIETGGDYVSALAGRAEIPVGATYEENALTRAEALIRTGSIEEGLQLIDAVRQYQNAQLPAVAGTGLTLAQALDELYRERRIALFQKNTPFYDYRRFGYACKGCQRTGVVVLGPGGAVNTNATIVYNYMDYFDVPLNELDFNVPGTGSAEVTFPF